MTNLSIFRKEKNIDIAQAIIYEYEDTDWDDIAYMTPVGSFLKHADALEATMNWLHEKV